MSKKIKFNRMFQRIAIVSVLAFMILQSSISASALTTYSNTYNVSPYGTWNIFIKKLATETTKKQYVKNMSGYGEYGYCYFRIQAHYGTDDTTVTILDKKKIYKNSTKTACTLSNTVDKGKYTLLRVTGADTQKVTDKAYITYWY